MYQYYVIEIQQYENGEYGHLVHFAHDEDPKKALNKGESKYHEVLAAAAVSDLPQHGAILIYSNCEPIMEKCYKNNAEGSDNGDN